MSLDLDHIADIVERLLDDVGEDTARPGLAETPERVAKLYADLLQGRAADPVAALRASAWPAAGTPRGTVLIRSAAFLSVCECDLRPFSGHVHLAYRPGLLETGSAGILAALETLAARVQTSDRLAGQLADAVMTALGCRGVDRVPFVNSSTKSVEEMSAVILQSLRLRD